MAVVAQRYQSELERIKENVKKSHDYFQINYKSFNDMRKFIFYTNLSAQERSTLNLTGKPQIEANVLEAYLSRLLGEFSKQEPSITVSADYNATVDPKMIDLVEGHMRHNLCDANKDGFEYEVYRNMISGGYDVAKILTKYANENSFEQIFSVERVFDPTLCGFDPLARLPHKGDGNYCYELYPKRKEELKEMGVDVKEFTFARGDESGFAWSYRNIHEDIALLCDYYEKKKKIVTIVQIADNDITGSSKVMTMDEYEKFVAWWEKQGFIAQVPEIARKRRTEKVIICRYVFCENRVLSYTETNFRYLPLVFFDGNSVLIKDSDNSSTQQLTRSYFYQALGTQRFKNFSMQTWANYLENMVQHKYLINQDSLPDSKDYQRAWNNFQIPANLVWKAFKDNDPNVPLPPPTPIPLVPLPQEVMGAYTIADQTIQNILGSYDASLGINDNQLSGVAIVEGATQSNAAAMPYIIGFLQGLNQLAEIQLDLIPKYYVTPRTIPVVGIDGKKTYQPINQEGGINLKGAYKENDLRVKVEAGVNFQIQKSRSVERMIALAQAIPSFAQFLNSQCMDIVLDNMEFRGIDEMKNRYEQYQQQMKQNPPPPDPNMIKAQLEQQKVQNQVQQSQVDNQLRAAQLQLDKQKADNDRIKLMAELQESHNNNIVQLEKAQTEKVTHAIDAASKITDMHHRHHKDIAEFAHKVVSEHNKGERNEET